MPDLLTHMKLELQEVDILDPKSERLPLPQPALGGNRDNPAIPIRDLIQNAEDAIDGPGSHLPGWGGRRLHAYSTGRGS